jgi:HSP20 family molecular chaperone IbpA
MNEMMNRVVPGFGFLFGNQGICDMLNRLDNTAQAVKQPAYEVSEDGKEIFVDLPGCKKEDISLELGEGGRLSISAKRVLGGNEKEYGVVLTMSNRNYVVDTENLKYEDGVLHIPVKEIKSEVKKLVIR